MTEKEVNMIYLCEKSEWPLYICFDYYNQSQWRVVTQISHRGKSYLPLFLSYLASIKRSKLTKIELWVRSNRMLRPLLSAPYSVLIFIIASVMGYAPPSGKKTNSFLSLSEITILVWLLVLNFYGKI